MFHLTTQQRNEQIYVLKKVLECIIMAHKFLEPSPGIMYQAKEEYSKIKNPLLTYEYLVNLREIGTEYFDVLFDNYVEECGMVQKSNSKIKNEISKIDLEGYIKHYDIIPDEFTSITAHDPDLFNGNSYSLVGPTIDAPSFQESHIIDVIKNVAIGHDVREIVKEIEANIVSLSYGRGEAFGTGLLIHPSLVLTARHCVPEEDFSEIIIKTNYQKTSSGIMHFGSMIKIAKKIEENIELDYAIIQLENAVKDFKLIQLELNPTFQEQMLLFHHPLGGPKKVSSNKIDQSKYYQLHSEGFHDTKKGTSGGVYVEADAKIVALHSIGKDRNSDGKISDLMTSRTTANWIKDIYSSSLILQAIYDEDGKPKAKIYEYSLMIDEMISDQVSDSSAKTEYNSKYEKILSMQPTGYLGVNEGRDRNLPEWSYHHIIGKGDMEFLWMMAQESNVLYNQLAKLLPQKYNYENDKLTAISVVWSSWNLFIGPTNRPEGLKPGFDPHNGYKSEPFKPISFPENHWNLLMNLSDKISRCSNIRTHISGIKKEDLIDLIESVHDGSSLDNCNVDLIDKKSYKKELNKIIIDLSQIYKIISNGYTDEDLDLKPPHKSINSDWTIYKGKYKLRTYENDGSPAKNVMEITEEEAHATLCIIASDSPANIKAIEEFSDSLVVLYKESRESLGKLLTIKNDIGSTNLDYSGLAFSAQLGLRFYSTLKYFFNIFGVDLPVNYMSAEAKGLIDLGLGLIKTKHSSSKCNTIKIFLSNHFSWCFEIESLSW